MRRAQQTVRKQNSFRQMNLANKTCLSDMEKHTKVIFDKLCKKNTEIQDINIGKYNNIFDEEEKKEIIQMIEQDNYEMRKQRILSGIRRDISDNFKKYNLIIGTEEKKVA
jgi:hypothetical protein